MKTAPLETLLSRVASQDRQAFSILFDRTAAKLFGVALRILNDPRAAETAVENAFVNIWRTADQYKVRRVSALNWMVAVVREAAIDEARNIGAPASNGKFDGNAPLAAFAQEDGAALAKDHERLDEALSALKEEQRGLLTSAFFQGRTYADMAETMDMPLGALKSGIRRSLLKLRDRLQPGAAPGNAEAAE